MERYVYKKVDHIIFGVLSVNDVEKMSVAKIVTPELYDKEGYPVDGGLMDIRLGVIDPGLRCKTCGEKLKECIGHFGHIELARPIIHVNFVKQILDCLKSTCSQCAKILLQEKEIEAYKAEIYKTKKEKNVPAYKRITKEIIASLKNIRKCPHCKSKQYSVKLEKPTTFMENDKRLSPIEVRARLEKISNEDCELLGLNSQYSRPEWFVLTLLPIPPVTIRPSITLESGERSEDDLTHKLGDIVRINQRLFENINAGAPEVIIEDLWELLQYHVTTYFDNTITQIPPARHRSGQPLRTLTERIKSKDGRFRHNLAGKRVNFTARAVISPDPMINFNEVGIPLHVAKELTVPERVNEWNIERLKEFVKRGPKNYPGANYVVRPDGKKKKITEETMQALLEELKEGYLVERQLMDGDIALFNRQPSLHRMSVMCHLVKVLPGRSFRLNPCACVAPDTLVQLSAGTRRTIAELRNCWKESELATYDKKQNRIKKTELKKFWALKPEAYGTKCYRVTTESGRSVTATADHPFYLRGSIKRAVDLRVGDLAIARPLETPVYKEINKVILRERDIVKNAPKETYLKHAIKVLEELKLIPLNLIDQRSMIISRLLGHLFGDGTFYLNKDSARMIFRGSRKDLEDMQSDIESLGFNPEKIYIKTSNGKIETIKGKILNVRGTGYSFEIRSKPLAILFAALGAPNGDKVKLKYGVPTWIINSPSYVQREFLGAYFGCEMTTPKIRMNTKSNFRDLVFKISKIQENIDSGRKFVQDISKLLKKIDVELKIKKAEDGVKRKDGYLTKILAGYVCDEKSKLNLLGKIGYVYNHKRDNIARLAYHYMLLKERETNSRNEKYKLAHTLRKKDYKFKDISRQLSISVPSLENWIYNTNCASLPSDFISFDAWCQKYADLQNGLVYDKITEIKETYVPFVYDVTTTSETHNFFANGFLTGNCHPYNADFDGDEMNLHIPQTEEARAEAHTLMQVQTQIMTPKHGLNVIGCVEDAISGNYILTKELEMSKEDAISLLLSINVDNVSFSKATVTGKEIFSTLIPKDFDFNGISKDKNEVIIKSGELIKGVIDNNSIGEENGLLIRELYRRYGEDFTLDVIEKIFKLGIKVLLKHGFTTGVQDTDLPKEVIGEVKEIIEQVNKDVQKLIKQYETKELELLPGKDAKATVEIKILQLLNKIRNRVAEVITQHVKGNNPTLTMARAGAKGNMLNLVQMAALVGQQALHGERIKRGYVGRTLSIFKKHDLSPESHGFISNSFKSGLNPAEFFFQAMTGRDALMDTALRTPKSGYLYRRLANALQDMKVEYDNTVRDANRSIVQFIYGDDGIDVSKSEGGTISVDKAIKDVTGK